MSVWISYTTRSKFLAAYDAAIRTHRGRLDRGEQISIGLIRGGNRGDVLVVIEPENQKAFETNWDGGAVTRFP